VLGSSGAGIDDLSRGELIALVGRLFGEVQELTRVNAELVEANAALTDGWHGWNGSCLVTAVIRGHRRRGTTIWAGRRRLMSPRRRRPAAQAR